MLNLLKKTIIKEARRREVVEFEKHVIKNNNNNKICSTKACLEL